MGVKNIATDTRGRLEREEITDTFISCLECSLGIDTIFKIIFDRLPIARVSQDKATNSYKFVINCFSTITRHELSLL